MTRGTVKSRLIHESKWVICSQMPKWNAVHRLDGGWCRKKKRCLRYSKAPPEKGAG